MNSWPSMVQQIAAGYGVWLTDEETSFILWEQTAYPLAPPWQVEQQVRERMRSYVADRFGRSCFGTTG